MRRVAEHRFKLNQDVVVISSGGPRPLIPRGRHLITRLLPLAGGEPRYTVRSKVDGLERAVMEGQLKLVEEPPAAAEPPAPKAPTRAAAARVANATRRLVSDGKVRAKRRAT